jgi:hypothetical protein
VARAAAGIDLVYEWEFEPSAGYGIWTKYTSHSYIGGIDPDGGGPGVEGDPFPVNVRVYNSMYTYGTAPPDSRDFDSVLVEVHGALPVDISDNGTSFAGSYQPDEVTGDVTVQLKFKIENGAPPYDSVWVDYDYDFMSFQNRVEITPTPGQGNYTYNLVIPDAEYKEYYIAVRVTDSDAPNVTDTYAWMTPVVIAVPMVLVWDSVTTEAKDALIGDLATIGLGYTEFNASSITAADVAGAALVIWHMQDRRGTDYPSTLTASQKAILTNYWDDGGSTIVMMSCESYYNLGGYEDDPWLRDYWGVDLNNWNYPYTYFYSYWAYWNLFFDNCPTYNGVASGPGGTVSNINYGKGGYPEHMLYIYTGGGAPPASQLLIGNGEYQMYGYYNTWYSTTVGGGTNVVYGNPWNSTNDASMTGTRSGLLRNLVEIANPDLM